MVGLAMIALIPLLWGVIRKQQGLPMFGAPTVSELERPDYLSATERPGRPSVAGD